VLFESPHRLERTLADLAVSFGPDRRVALARELTKLHEEIWRGTLGGAVDRADRVEPRGEYVVVVEGAPPPAEPGDDEIGEALSRAIAAGQTTKDAVAAVSQRLGVAKRRVYDLAVRP
jgi:16S rRNA (cytidine1402-2'-O)-methyltransferase